MCFVLVSDGGLKIKWVDNTHALGIFSSEAAGERVVLVSRVLSF